MSTRAVIAFRKGNNTWYGVWNHWAGHPQFLGKALIERIALMDGQLTRFAGQFIERCPEGWSNFAQGERSNDGGIWTGTCIGDEVTYSTLPDAQYLYLLDPQGRRLQLFPVRRGRVRPIETILFDESGAAAPAAFTPVPE